MTYARARKAAVIALLGYALIGFSAHMLSRGQEDAYPFFSWFLFVNVPQHTQTDFEIVIIRANGADLAEPVPAADLPDIFSPIDERDLDALAERLGRAAIERSGSQMRAARAQIEGRLESADVTYGIREYTYDPIEYYKSKRIATSSIIATFDAGQ